jgi:polyphosphate kinase 2 (PPK2 family)
VEKSYGFTWIERLPAIIVDERFLKRCASRRKSSSKLQGRLGRLQREARQVQNRLFLAHRAAVVVFEGWDAAGKGGAIKRLVAQLETRRFEVLTPHPPTSEELTQHYLRRYWKNIPRAGFLAIFDRSWYAGFL